MPDTPKAPVKAGLSTPAGKKKAILIGGGVLVAIALGLYLRKRIGQGGGSTAASPYVASDGSGGSGGGGVVPGDLTGTPSLADTLNGLIPYLGGGSTITYNYYGSGAGNGSAGTTTTEATAPAPAPLPGTPGGASPSPEVAAALSPSQPVVDSRSTPVRTSTGAVAPTFDPAVTPGAYGPSLSEFNSQPRQTVTSRPIDHPAVKATVKPAAQKAVANKDLTKILTPSQLANLKKVAA